MLTSPLDQLLSLDIFALGMIFLDLIRGRVLNQSEASLFNSLKNNKSLDSHLNANVSFHPNNELYSNSVVDWSQIITNLLDSAFNESIFQRRRVYPLISLIEICLSESSSNRPNIESLVNRLVDAYQYIMLTPPHLPVLSTVPLDSSSNQSNLAICDFEFGRLESARTRLILSLSSNPSNIDLVWNMNLFRWKIGEITPNEFIDILSRHESQFYYNAVVHRDQKVQIKKLMDNIILECCQKTSPIYHFHFVSLLITSIEALNLGKLNFEFLNSTTLNIKTLLNTYQISYNFSDHNFYEYNLNKKFQNNHVMPQPQDTSFFQNISLIFDSDGEGVSLSQSSNGDHPHEIQLKVGETIQFDSTVFFVERPIGYDIYAASDQTVDPLIYIFLEGCWAHGTEIEANLDNGNGNENGNYYGDFNDEVSSDFEYPTESIGSQSSQSNRDQNHTPAPPNRHYVIITGYIHTSENQYQPQHNGRTHQTTHNNRQKQTYQFELLCYYRIIGLSADQRPSKIKLITHDTLIVSGTGGLLASISPLSFNYEKNLLLQINHISNDFFLQTSSSTDGDNDEVNPYSTITKSDIDNQSKHDVAARVIDFSYSSRTHTLVSGDSLGILCIWKEITKINSSPFTSFESFGYSLDVKSQIHYVVHSRENMLTLVSTDYQVLFIQVCTETLKPTMYIQSVLDSTNLTSNLLCCPPQYVTQFVDKYIHIWKVTTIRKRNIGHKKNHNYNNIINSNHCHPENERPNNYHDDCDHGNNVSNENDDEVYDSMMDEEVNNCPHSNKHAAHNNIQQDDYNNLINIYDEINPHQQLENNNFCLKIELIIHDNPHYSVKFSERMKFRYFLHL